MGEAWKISAYILITLVFLLICRAYMEKKQKSKEEIRLVTAVIAIMIVGNLASRFLL